MKDIIISSAVKYIGVDDTDLDLFEGQYIIPDGVSYNSYLIIDEKIAILDTVDARKTDQWITNLDTELNGKTPDYLIISHMEPDHASNIKLIMQRFPNLTGVCSARAVPMMKRFFNSDFNGRIKVVAEGETLSLGQHTLQFFMAPMVHWPEVMVTYEQSEKILFSADGFGKFGALSVDADWACEARRYYFNICGKYGAQVQALLKKAASLNIDTICPLHGPILNDNLDYYISLYDTWSSYRSETKGIFIAYCSLHGNTAVAASMLCQLLKSKTSLKVAITDLSRSDMSEAIEDAFRYDRLVIAAPTYDGGVMPVMDDFLAHLKAKNFQNKKVGIIENGSWAPMAGRKMREAIESLKNITILEPMVTVESTVKDATIEQLSALADALA